MRKIALIIAVLFGTVAAKAVELKSGSLYCVNQKKIIAYYNYLENKAGDYAQRLLNNSDCFVKKRDETVLLKSSQKKYVELELLSGFKVWTKKENIKEEK